MNEMDKETVNKCELCNGTKFYGDNGPGRRGNNEFVRCEICNPDTPSKPAEPLHKKSAEWMAGYLWGLSGAAEVKESHERLLEAATAVVMLWDIGSDDRLKDGIKLLITAIEAQRKDGKG